MGVAAEKKEVSDMENNWIAIYLRYLQKGQLYRGFPSVRIPWLIDVHDVHLIKFNCTTVFNKNVNKEDNVYEIDLVTKQLLYMFF